MIFQGCLLICFFFFLEGGCLLICFKPATIFIINSFGNFWDYITKAIPNILTQTQPSFTVAGRHPASSDYHWRLSKLLLYLHSPILMCSAIYLEEKSKRNFDSCISYICIPSIVFQLLLVHVRMSERIGNSLASSKLPIRHLLRTSSSRYPDHI